MKQTFKKKTKLENGKLFLFAKSATNNFITGYKFFEKCLC